MVRITSGGGLGAGTQVTTSDGIPVEGVARVELDIAPDRLVVARIGLCVSSVDVIAHPLLTLETLREAAAAYGYVLVPAD